MRDFAAIDFETANNERTSVCSVGVVIVRNGEIVDSFYSLIKPEPNYYNYWYTQVHGLTRQDTEDAPIFPEVWKQIEPLIEGLPLRPSSALTRWTTLIIRSTAPASLLAKHSQRQRTTSCIPSLNSVVIISKTTIMPSQMPKPAPGSPGKSYKLSVLLEISSKVCLNTAHLLFIFAAS